MSEHRLKERHEIPEHLTWDLTDNFADTGEGEQAFKSAEEYIEEAKTFQGRLGNSGEELLRFLRWEDESESLISRIYNYAHLLRDQDARHTEHLEMEQCARSLIRQYTVATSWANPEIIALDPELVKGWLERVDGLGHYQHALDKIMRFQPHTLSPSEESLLAAAGEALGGGRDAFSALNDADLTFPNVHDEEGNEVELTRGRYALLLESQNREVREEAYRAIFGTYRKYSNTFAATLGSAVKTHVFNAEARNYESAREAATFRNAIPETVHQTLIETVGNRTDLLHRYVELRKKVLGIDDLKPFDLYTPLVKDVDLHYSYEEAQELIIKALKPLGEEYEQILRKCFDERWIDVMENRGKRSGAYSSGTYGTNPHILLNWNGTLDAVFTLAHELGHSLHSYLTWDNQSYVYGSYGIFLAEIASTTNEILLTGYLLENNEDPNVQAYVINHYLDGFKGTVFRQTQFAEFEHEIHQMAHRREPLTAGGMSELYGKINAKYYGDGLEADEDINHEWMRIPHFYMNYYVYQYSTGFSAATAFAKAIEEEGQPAVDRYLAFLKSGSSAYPIDILKDAGLDMTTSEPIDAALDSFERYLDAFEKTL